METGCQNIQLCMVILKVAFPPQVIGPMFLFPLIYIAAQCTEAVLLALCYRCYQTVSQRLEGKCHSCARVFLPSEGTAAVVVFFGDLPLTSAFPRSDGGTCKSVEIKQEARTSH